MKNKINIAYLLKDCPQDMELNCAMYDNLYFDSVNSDYYGTINCYTLIDGIKTSINFTKYGTFNNHPGAKCVIFPKSKTTWDGFVPPCKFKDGDILATDLGSVFFLNTRLNTDEYYGCFVGKGSDGSFHICEPFAYKECCGLATEEEKEKLFQAIKDKGYHWNAKTKTLDKLIEPQFKVGDKIRHKTNNKDDIYEISKVYDDSYGLVGFTWMLYMKHQDNWELVIEPKFKVGDEIVKRNSISNSWIVSSVSSEYYGLKLPKGIEGIGVLPISEQDDWELLSDIRPKFKVGDTIQDEDGYKVKITEVNLEDEYYRYESIIAKGIGGIAFSNQNNWKLVPNIESKFKVGDRIKYIYFDRKVAKVIKIHDEKYELDNGKFIEFQDENAYEIYYNKFDITTLKPFDKVLVRSSNAREWTATFYSHYSNDYFFGCGMMCQQCIPYEGNEHLLGTTKDCDKYYKIWE